MNSIDSKSDTLLSNITTIFPKIFIAFSSGILVAEYLNVQSFQFLMLFFSALFISILYIVITTLNIIRYREWCSSLIIVLLMFSAGGYLMHRHTINVAFDTDNKEHIYLVETLEIPIEKDNTYSIQCKVIEAYDTINENLEQEKFILYIKKDSISDYSFINKLPIASNLLIKARITTANFNSNIIGFNYDKYLSRKGFCGVAFITPDKYAIITSLYKLSSISVNINQLQSYLVDRFSFIGINSNNAAILSAITLGEKALLSHDQKNYFSSAGASHILVVSGMHVGYIFALIFLLLTHISTKKNRWLIVLSGIALMWFYASLTGLAPSVVRATFIFSLMLFMQIAGLRYKVSNAIFMSATILLIANPNTLFDVGFQLSYLAFISILFFLPRLNKLMRIDKIRYRYLKWFVMVINVSLAAQILTMPIVLYHFHQLPLYFILTNLIVSIFAPIIFFGGFISLICSFIPPISLLIGKIMNYILSVFDYMIQYISSLPMSVMQGTISTIQCVLLYLLIYMIAETIIAFEKNHNNKVIIIGRVVVVLSMMIIVSFESICERNSISQLIVQDTKELEIDIQTASYQHQIVRGVNSYFIYDNHSYMVLCDDDIFRYKTNNGTALEVDYLIIDKGVYPTDRLLQFISPHYVIFTKAVWDVNIPLFEKIFNDIECYNISRQGAFIDIVH